MDAQRLSPTEFASTVSAITAAFGDITRRDIYLHVHQNPDGVTASEVAEEFELHANVARHHLDKLTAGGHLGVEVAKPDGGVGRPSKHYRPMHTEVRLEVNVRHDDVLVSLLGRALAMLPAHAAEEMAEEVGVEYGKAMAAGDRSQRDSPQLPGSPACRGRRLVSSRIRGQSRAGRGRQIPDRRPELPLR